MGMQLRDHPSLYIWPPKGVDHLSSESLPSEESEHLILKKVEIRPPYIWVSAEYAGKNYFSTITTLRDPEFFDLLYQKLNNSIGQTIREIGDSQWED
jgi:hypothetical protein